MRRFNYQAKNSTGKLVRGKVEAPSPQEAARLLASRGLVVLKISPEIDFPLISLIRGFTTKKVSTADIALMTRQFATMISAGLPITDALLIMKEQSGASLKTVVNKILTDIDGGSTLSSALEKYPQAFSKVYVSLVKAGEAGGVMDKVLNRMAENLENQREFQSKVKGALIYPIIVVIGMIAVAAVMMFFVLPKIMTIYEDFQVELPLPTRILMKVTTLSASTWWLFPLLILGAYMGYKAFTNTNAGREKVAKINFKFPITGNLSRQIVLAEFTRTLGLLVGAGIPILQGLKIVSDSVDNVLIKNSLVRASDKVEKGFSLSYALSQEAEVFPPLLYQLLAVGEETGKIDETLFQVSSIYEKESGYAVKGLTAAIEPIIMIVLGVGVGFLVIAVIMPMFSLSSQF